MRQVKIEAARWPFMIGCVSDTHIPGRARHLPERLLGGLAGAALILHAGDIVSPGVLAELGVIAPVLAVAGNMDPHDLAHRLGRSAWMEIGPWRVGIVHGDEGAGGTTPERALRAFGGSGPAAALDALERPGRPDVVVFGHSHRPLCEVRDGVLLLNPGSPTDHRFAPRPSLGLLTLYDPAEGRPPHGEIVRL
jgi:putative phosphoesterase